MLKLLSLVYLGIVNIRNFCYDYALFLTYKSDLPVICVGNLTVGGNGKTPLVEYLVKYLKSQHKQPVILTRGYGGKCSGPYQVQDEDSPDFVGDEALQLYSACSVPVVVARDRYLGAKLIESQQLGDVIVMDDGFQHRRLQRDVNIVCFDVGTKQAIECALSGELLPKGRYREPWQKALKRIDAVFFNSRGVKTDQASYSELIRRFESKQIYYTDLTIEEVKNIKSGQELEAKEVIVVSSIAKPDNFYKLLDGAGYSIKEKFAFSDHYSFNQNDLDQIANNNSISGLPIVCTEKDAVKLKYLKTDNIFSVKVKLRVEGDMEKLFNKLLDN